MKVFSNLLISSKLTLRDGLVAINQLNDDILCLFVIDSDDRLIGTLTNGDVRRALIRDVRLTDAIEFAMEKDFKSIYLDEVSPLQIRKFRNDGIKILPCLDEEGRIIRIYDLVSKQSVLPIDAILMAGGKGERLRPLTENTPKPLLKVGDKAIIDYNIDRLMQFGVEHIHVIVNYLADQIETHFLNDRNGIRINCIREPRFLGTMGAVKMIPHLHHDTILVMNSDLFTNIDLEEFYIHFIENNADFSVAAIPYSVSVPYGIFELENERIIGLREKPTYNYYANGGIYLIKRKLLNLIPEDTFFDATDLIEKLIENGLKVVRFPIIGYWIDIGKPEDYMKVQEFVKHIRN